MIQDTKQKPLKRPTYKINPKYLLTQWGCDAMRLKSFKLLFFFLNVEIDHKAIQSKNFY